MPTYTYHCEACGVRFDQFQKFSEDALLVCPQCGEPRLRKVYQAVGIVFKGKGFYATDHRSPSGMKAASTDAKAESTSTETKTASTDASTKADASKTASTEAAKPVTQQTAS